MASFFPGCFLFPVLVFLHHITRTTQQPCGTKYCGSPSRGPSIRFPFYLKGAQRDDCGYPGFGVSCNNLNHTMIRLGDAGDFVVKKISLKDHQVFVNDPNSCLPFRFLNGDLDFRLKGSPFQWIPNKYVYFANVDFLNCSAPLPRNSLHRLAHKKIPCLSGTGADNFTVIAVWLDDLLPTSTPFPPDQCHYMSSTLLPVEGLQVWDHLYSDLGFKWNNCTYPDNPDDEDSRTPACYNSAPDQEPATGHIYYKLLAVGGAGALFFCVAGLARLLGVMAERSDGGRRRMDGSESDRRTMAESVDVGMGLDESTIEQYPTTQVGQSGRLPNPTGDNICSICLSEYEPMDTLRTIPHCDHYFHAHCIDSWLKKKGTCPLCRYLPHASTPLYLSSSHSHRLLNPS